MYTKKKLRFTEKAGEWAAGYIMCCMWGNMAVRVILKSSWCAKCITLNMQYWTMKTFIYIKRNLLYLKNSNLQNFQLYSVYDSYDNLYWCNNYFSYPFIISIFSNENTSLQLYIHTYIHTYIYIYIYSRTLIIRTPVCHFNLNVFR